MYEPSIVLGLRYSIMYIYNIRKISKPNKHTYDTRFKTYTVRVGVYDFCWIGLYDYWIFGLVKGAGIYTPVLCE